MCSLAHSSPWQLTPPLHSTNIAEQYFELMQTYCFLSYFYPLILTLLVQLSLWSPKWYFYFPNIVYIVFISIPGHYKEEAFCLFWAPNQTGPGNIQETIHGTRNQARLVCKKSLCFHHLCSPRNSSLETQVGFKPQNRQITHDLSFSLITTLWVKCHYFHVISTKHLTWLAHVQFPGDSNRHQD